MTSITYQNFISKKIDSKFGSNFLFTNVRSLYVQEYYDVVYSISVSQVAKLVEAQAKSFARRVSSIGYFRGTFLNNLIREEDKIEQLLSEVYVYSYVKSVTFGFDRFKNRVGFVNFGSNRVLTGHKVLYDFISRGNIQGSVSSETFVNLKIRLKDEDIKLLCDTFSVEQRFMEDQSFVHNSTLETVLDYLHTHANDLVSTLEFDSTNGNVFCREVQTLSISPIGNSCFGDNSKVNYIECDRARDYIPSMFWGIAVGLKLESVLSIDEDDFVYDNIRFEDLDVRTIGMMVHAIAGFNPSQLRETPIDSGGSNNGGNQGGPVSGESSNPSRGGRNGNNNQPRFRSRSRNVQNQGSSSTPSNSTNTLRVKINSSLARRIVNGAARLNGALAKTWSDVDTIINDDNVRNIASTLGIITSASIKINDLIRYKGRSVKVLMNDLNFSPIRRNIRDGDGYLVMLENDNRSLVALPDSSAFD